MDSKNSKIDPKAQKWAENWLPIKGIQNGEIILDNGKRVTGVKIKPRNIFILDYDSQANAIFNLRNFYNTLDYEFWIIVSDRPVDINVYLAQLKLLFNSVQTQAIRKLIKEDIDKARHIPRKRTLCLLRHRMRLKNVIFLPMKRHLLLIC